MGRGVFVVLEPKDRGHHITRTSNRGYGNTFTEEDMIERIDAARRFAPMLERLNKLLDKPVKTGRPMTKKQGQALVDYIRSQAGPVYGEMFRSALESRDHVGLIRIIKELIALEMEEHRVGKRVPQPKVVKPDLRVMLPRVKEVEVEGD